MKNDPTAPKNARWKRCNILGVNVSSVTLDDFHAHILRCVTSPCKSLMLHVNAHAFNIAASQPWFRDLLNRADLVFADGAGVLLAARILGHRLPQRMTGADWTWDLAKFAAANGIRLFLLGGLPGVAEKAASRLCEHAPGLMIAGTHHGYFDKRPDSAENDAVIALINNSRVHVLLVGFGMPLQERWLLENWDRIDANVALTIGAAMDYVSGKLRRGPRWMTESGFEWLARLLIEPRRLWRRYLLGNPLFLWRVLRFRFKGEKTSRRN